MPTDGKPNHLDVDEGRHGLEDTDHGVQAERDAGSTPCGVMVDERTHSGLPYLFGARGVTLVRDVCECPARLAPAYAALTR